MGILTPAFLENEIASGKFTVKRLADAVQESLSEAELVAELEWE